MHAYSLNLRGTLLPLDRPRLMAVVNCTPDSFYAGGRNGSVDLAIRAWDAGADLVDVGGQSTRPGAEPVGAAEEWRRLPPVLEGLLAAPPEALVSVDTSRAEVARRAVEAGAVLVNDVSGGALDPELWQVVADAGVPYVLTHLQGTPETMQDRPTYSDVVADVHLALGTRLHQAREAGLGDILIDVGFGFGKTLEQNYALLAALDSFHILGAPLLVGVSRKSMVYKALGTGPEEALNGTTALHAWALDRGAHFLRVHDVEAAREVLTLFHQFHPAPLPGPWPA